MVGDSPGVVIGVPDEVVDLLLWREAQRALARHRDRGGGVCVQCWTAFPCAGYRLAQRATWASRQAKLRRPVRPAEGPEARYGMAGRSGCESTTVSERSTPPEWALTEVGRQKAPAILAAAGSAQRPAGRSGRW